MRTKLAIIGSAPGKEAAPYSNDLWNIWAISGAAFSESLDGTRRPDTADNTWNCVTRVDVFFEMHKRHTFGSRIEALNRAGLPVYMQMHEMDIPASVPYPINDVIADVGEDFSSSIAYMLAFGIHSMYEEIELFGINMLHESEYASQRPAIRYYMGIARERGIVIRVPDVSQLYGTPYRYGYDDVDIICTRLKDRKKALEADMEKKEQEIKNMRAGFYQLRGASLDCDALIDLLQGGI